ncbi:MAG: hypothetical protein SFX18_16505 [Pirellulales bacterium]|nr:hypothetical protein [Pirellulales bacterium]
MKMGKHKSCQTKYVLFRLVVSLLIVMFYGKCAANFQTALTAKMAVVAKFFSEAFVTASQLVNLAVFGGCGGLSKNL